MRSGRRNAGRRRLSLGCVLALALAACTPRSAREEIDLAASLGRARSGSETVRLDLGSDASLPALVSGWGPRARSGDVLFQWGQGDRSELRFGVSEPRDLEIAVRAWPLAFEAAPLQRVAVEANGRPVGSLELPQGPHTHRIRLPADALVPGENRLAFRYAWSRAPREVIAGSSEHRPLAVAWDTLRILGARRHGEPSAIAGPGDPALLLPLATWVDFYLRVPDAGRLRIAALEPFGDPEQAALEIETETAAGATALSRHAIGRAVDLALPDAAGDPIRISLRSIGSAADGATAGLRLVRPVLDLPVAPADAPAEASSPSAPRPNVVVYLIDTLRPDHLGSYGHARPTSPHIDAFARDATLFRNAIAQSSWTKTAVASLFTGLLPQTHRIHSRSDSIPEGLPLLAELLRDEGYLTLGVITNGNVSRAFGFARGFDVYEELREEATREIHQPSDRANEVAFELLAHREDDRPFFLYLHTSDPHWPYTPPEPERARLAAEVADPSAGFALPLKRLQRASPGLRRDLGLLYDAEIAFNDESFGSLIEKLRELDPKRETLVALLSDHGEAFFEHSNVGHGETLFGEEIRIPLAIRFPGGIGRGEVVDTAARQVDLLPTILESVGAPIPPGLPGRSLLPAARAPRTAREPDTSFASLDRAGRVLEAAIEGERKLIRFRVEGRGVPALGLFDLASDPGETRDLSASERVWREYLLARLDAAEREAPPVPAPSTGSLDEEQRRALEALGYLDD
jgi:arylsulfatase A-like enzyme